MTKPVAFSEDGARRVIAATKAHEAGNRDMPGIRFRDTGDDGDQIRIGKTTAEWGKGNLGTVTLYENGNPPYETTANPPTTLTAVVNKFANVSANKWVALGRGINGAWYLIAAEC